MPGPQNKTDTARPSEQPPKSAKEKYFRLERPRVTHPDKNNGGPRSQLGNVAMF